MIKHLHIIVDGRVQGVNFRYYTQQKAEELDIHGLVHNEYDGSVDIRAEGEENQLKKFVDWCKQGPDGAKVTKVDVEEGDVRNFQDFRIEY